MISGASSAELVIAEPNSHEAELLVLLSAQRGIRAVAAEDGKSALDLIDHSTKAFLLEIELPGWDGFRCLEFLTAHHPSIPTIVLSHTDQAAAAVKALQLGASHYLTKPFDPEELFFEVYRAFKQRSLGAQGMQPTPPQVTGESDGPTMVATSPAMSDLMEKAEKIAPLDAGVLLTGESGVGKGILARKIHALSPRADRPFVVVSCPALPRDLLESELFGHEKGAFTGAIKRRIGKIESAAGGTLFLDEIGELPIDLQPKLLSVLQDRQFHRVGGEKIIHSNIRLIAATNIDFSGRIRDGSFRKDLYYRISAIPLDIPPLRDRPEEIAPLIRQILADIADRRSTPLLELSPDAMVLAERYHWPGNIREMENILERSSAFCGGHTITAVDLPAEFHSLPNGEHHQSIADLGNRPLTEIERAAIMQSLKLCNGNKAETARRLGISEKSIYNKIRSYQAMPS